MHQYRLLARLFASSAQ